MYVSMTVIGRKMWPLEYTQVFSLLSPDELVFDPRCQCYMWMLVTDYELAIRIR